MRCAVVSLLGSIRKNRLPDKCDRQWILDRGVDRGGTLPVRIDRWTKTEIEPIDLIIVHRATCGFL